MVLETLVLEVCCLMSMCTCHGYMHLFYKYIDQTIIENTPHTFHHKFTFRDIDQTIEMIIDNQFTLCIVGEETKAFRYKTASKVNKKESVQ